MDDFILLYEAKLWLIDVHVQQKWFLAQTVGVSDIYVISNSCKCSDIKDFRRSAWQNLPSLSWTTREAVGVLLDGRVGEEEGMR